MTLSFRYSEYKYCTVVTDDNRGNEEITMITKLVSNDNKRKQL